MNKKMNKDKKILIILVTLIAVVLLATLWVVIGPISLPMGFQGGMRLNLTEERRREIEQLMENMRNNGAGWDEIQAAVRAKLMEWGTNPPPPGDIELFYTIKTVVSTVNIALAIILFLNYIEIYQKTKSEFTVGLMIFSIIILFYTLTSNPITQWIFGFSAFGLGPFVMLPDLFTCISLFILLYLSVKY